MRLLITLLFALFCLACVAQDTEHPEYCIQSDTTWGFAKRHDIESPLLPSIKVRHYMSYDRGGTYFGPASVRVLVLQKYIDENGLYHEWRPIEQGEIFVSGQKY